MPLPQDCALTKGVNTSSRISSGIPCPLSRTRNLWIVPSTPRLDISIAGFLSLLCSMELRIRLVNSWKMLVGLETTAPVSYTHLRAHETRHDLVCRLLLE